MLSHHKRVELVSPLLLAICHRHNRHNPFLLVPNRTALLGEGLALDDARDLNAIGQLIALVAIASDVVAVDFGVDGKA